jgi:hypothetical protein
MTKEMVNILRIRSWSRMLAKWCIVKFLIAVGLNISGLTVVILWEATATFSFRKSVHMEKLSYHFGYSWNLISEYFSKIFQVYSGSLITGNFIEGEYTFMITSRSVLSKMRNVSDKICTKICKTFPINPLAYEINVKNILGPNGPHVMVWPRSFYAGYSSLETHSEYVTVMLVHSSNGCRNESQCYMMVHGPFIATENSNISKYMFEVACTRRWGYKLCNYFISYFLSKNYYFPIYLCVLLSVINCDRYKFRTPLVVSILCNYLEKEKWKSISGTYASFFSVRIICSS